MWILPKRQNGVELQPIETFLIVVGEVVVDTDGGFAAIALEHNFLILGTPFEALGPTGCTIVCFNLVREGMCGPKLKTASVLQGALKGTELR